MTRSPVEATINWVNGFVIKLGLCPFAARPMLEKTVRFVACEASEFDDLMRHFLGEALLLTEVAASEILTSLIVYPQALTDFADFLDFKVAVEEISSDAGLDALVQLAHFHPDYCFAGVPADDPANATNRSPFPVLQLLRVAETAEAIAAYPDVENIPIRNIELLRARAK